MSEVKPERVDIRTIVEELRRDAVGPAGLPGGRAILPSRDAVIQIVEDLRSVFFPGYFGTTDVSAESLHYFLGATLERTIRALEEQVRRAVAFVERHDYFTCEHCAKTSQSVATGFLAKVPTIRRLLASDVEAALKPLKRAAELAPQSPQMQYNLAFAYFQLGQFAAARVPLEHALKRWPDLFPLNSLYGAVLFKLGDYEPAYQALGRAHTLNSQDAATRELMYATAFALAGSSAEKGQLAEAIRYLKKAAMLKPAEAEPHQRLAEYYAKINRAAEAEADRGHLFRIDAVHLQELLEPGVTHGSRSWRSSEAMAPNDQHEPHCPWSLTGDILPESRRSKEAGAPRNGGALKGTGGR